MSAALGRDETSTAKGTGRALVPFVAAAQRTAGAWTPLRAALVIVCFGLAVGAGGGTIYGLRHVLPWPRGTQPGVSTAVMHRLEDQVGKLQQGLDALRVTADASRPDEPLRGIKRSVEALRQDIDQVRSNSSANVAQLSAKIDKTEHDPNPKLVEIVARLDRIEKQAALTTPTTTGAIPVAAHVTPAPAGAVKPVAAVATQPLPKPVATAAAALPPAARTAPAASAPQPAVKPLAPAATPARTEITQVPATPPASLPSGPTTLAGWALRDVYDGMALVEARNGGLREIQPGQYLPGAGQIRSIERRGRSWVVLTSRGVIQNTTF